MDRIKIIKKMRKERWTYKDIGKVLGISSQRVNQILFGLDCAGGGRDYVREQVRRRDKHTCQDCGIVRKTKDIFNYNSKLPTLKGRKKALDIHHLNGLCGKKSKQYDSKKNMIYLITLCHKCHYNRPEHKCKSKKFKQNQLKRLSTIDLNKPIVK